MKRLLPLALLLCGCHAHAQQAPLALEDKKMETYIATRKPATLSIKFNNLPDSATNMEIKCSFVEGGAKFQVARVYKLDANGQLDIKLDSNMPPQQIWVNAGDYYYSGVIVDAGLTITIDVKKLPKDGAYLIDPAVTYSGPDAGLNIAKGNATLYRKKEKEKINDAIRDVAHAKKDYTEKAFLSKLDSLYKGIDAINNEYLAKHPDFGSAIKNEELSQYYDNLIVAYWQSEMPDQVFKRITDHKPAFVSNDGMLFYKYLATYVQWYKHPVKKANSLERELKLADSLFNQERADIVKFCFMDSERDLFESSYPKIIASIKTKWVKDRAAAELVMATANKKRVDSLFNNSKKLEAANIGKPLVQTPFNANLYLVDADANVDEFITNLKLKFPNKAIIVDFWATWCAPCLSDMPFSKKLHENNADLPIEYVYLCTSSQSNMELWKSRIGDMQLPGTHIFVNEVVLEKIRAIFNATSGFPAYVLIEKNGKIDPKIISRMSALDKASLRKIAGL